MTSKQVGMAVPDWPNSYGYSMFTFPISKWVGGIFYEHSHRLFASLVGVLTILLSAGIYWKDRRPWLRRLSLLAVLAVIIQGIFGGFRVVFDRHGYGDELGIIHATLAQLFFALVCSIVLFLSRWWAAPSLAETPGWVRTLSTTITGMVLMQLILGASMRHQHAGLAVPDFPLAHGKVWPEMNPEAVERYNQNRAETTALKPITANHLFLHMLHRLTGVAIFLTVLAAAGLSWVRLGKDHLLSKISLVWLALVFSQVILGAATIWSRKSADIATLHVAVGALIFMIGVMTILVYRRMDFLGRATQPLINRGGLVNLARAN